MIPSILELLLLFYIFLKTGNTFAERMLFAVIQFKHAKKKVKFWLIVEKLLFSVDNYFRGSSKTLSKIKQRKKFFILISTKLVTYYVVGSRQYGGRVS